MPKLDRRILIVLVLAAVLLPAIRLHNPLADHDAIWYYKMAIQMATLDHWVVEGKAPFLPGYSLTLVPGLWLGLTGKWLAISGLSVVVFLVTIIVRGAQVRLTWFDFLPFLTWPVQDAGLFFWSEVASLPLLWCLLLLLREKRLGKEVNLAWIGWCLALLLVTRWANLIWVVPVLAFPYLFTDRYNTKTQWWTLTFCATLPLFCCMGVQYMQTHHLLGYDRIGPEQDLAITSVYQWLVAFRAIFFPFVAPVWWVQAQYGKIVIGLLIQMAIIMAVYRTLRPRLNQFSTLIPLYLLWLAALERITELDPIDSRLLSPLVVMIVLGFTTTKQMVDHTLSSLHHGQN